MENNPDADINYGNALVVRGGVFNQPRVPAVIANVYRTVIVESNFISFLNWLRWVLFTNPLQQFYFRGLWRNRAAKDICAAVTNYVSDFWHQHADECAIILFNEFDAWAAYIEFCLYAVLFIIVVLTLVRCCCLICCRLKLL